MTVYCTPRRCRWAIWTSLAATFALAAGLHAAALVPADDEPRFTRSVLAPSSAQGFLTSAYPVVARLASGRLLCLYAARPADADSSDAWRIVSTVSDDQGGSWSQPQVIFNHEQASDVDPNLIVDGERVLAFSTTVPAPYKIDRTEVYARESRDGVQWKPETRVALPHRYVSGKIHQGHRLADGTLVMGYAWDRLAERGAPPPRERAMEIEAGMLRSRDGGRTWTPGADLYVAVPKTSDRAIGGFAEPATVLLADGRLMTLLRTGGATFYQSWSRDGGETWEPPRPSTITAHNSPAALWRLDGATDIIAAWDNSPTERTPLVVARSTDGGRTWLDPKVVVNTPGRQASYPSVTQARDGTIVLVWQQQLEGTGREIHLARFNRRWLDAR